METALHTSTADGWTAASRPSETGAATPPTPRYWVGFRPIWLMRVATGDLGELALRPLDQPSRGPLQERAGGVGEIWGRGDASDRQGGDRQLGKLVEQLR